MPLLKPSMLMVKWSILAGWWLVFVTKPNYKGLLMLLLFMSLVLKEVEIWTDEI